MKKLLLAIIMLSTSIFASTYEIDGAHTKVTFKVKHMAIANVYGTFSKFDSVIEYDEATKMLQKVETTIDVKSIDTENKKRDKHLRSKDFFDVKKFPELTFKLLKIDGDKAVGNLTIKGITKEVTFDYENNGTVKDPWGNTKLGFALEAKIDRRDFGLTWNKILETGGLVVGHDIKLIVDVEAKQVK